MQVDEPEESLEEIENAFNAMCRFILDNCKIPSLRSQKDQLVNTANVLLRADLMNSLREYIELQTEETITTTVYKKFYGHFDGNPISEEDTFIDMMERTFAELLDNVQQLYQVVDKMLYVQAELIPCSVNLKKTKLSHSKIIQWVKAILFGHVDDIFIKSLDSLYFCGYKCFDAVTKQERGVAVRHEVNEKCEGCSQHPLSCTCEEILDKFHQINSILRELQLLELLSGSIVTRLIHQRIFSHVEHMCKASFDTRYLDLLEDWLDKKVVLWLEILYGSQSKLGSGDAMTGTDERRDAIMSHKERLAYHLYQVYAKARIDELFSITIDFPDSIPALEDIRDCLEKVNLRDCLVETMKHAINSRLLHPGVFTGDIITAYVNIIKALRMLDPTNVLLDRTCDSIHLYLRKRADTVRCIVSMLTDHTDLSEELNNMPAALPEEPTELEHQKVDWMNWKPDPVDARPVEPGQNRNADIVTILVNIYGSKDTFVQEYQSLLADRILTSLNFDVDKEIRHLELLKIRFSDMEEEMHRCEVMLKDVGDSKRINAFIAERKTKEELVLEEEEPEDDLSLSGLIVSSHFWPDTKLKDETVELPKPMQDAMSSYTKSFEALKGNRTLHWKPTLGMVEVEIEQNNRLTTHQVTPPVAAIIWQFQQKKLWSVEELSQTLKMSSTAVKRRATVWQAQGLLRETSEGVLELVEDPSERPSGDQMGPVCEDEELEDMEATAVSTEAQEEAHKILFNYIHGMLQNFGANSVEKIQSMLKMLTFPVPVDTSTTAIQRFLDQKVREGKLEFSAGNYNISKS